MTTRGKWLFADEWIAGQSGDGVTSHQWTSRERLMLSFTDLHYERPNLAWEMILLVLSRTNNERVLGILSAGPLEDLLVKHGEEFIENVREQVVLSEKFRALLKGVWLAPEDTPIWKEIYNLVEIEPPFPEGWRDHVEAIELE